MKATEAAALLTIAAAYDNRKPDADQAKAWAMALDGLRFEDCREAIVRYYQGSKEWLMPADVISGVKRLRFKRVADHPPVTPPSWLDPDNVHALIRWERETTEAIADGTYRPEDDLAPDAIAGRDVIGELGQAGQSIDMDEIKRQARERNDEARRKIAEREAASRRRRDERQAELERMREADRAARDATTAEPHATGCAADDEES